jgi:hypothetical protein
MSYQQGDAPAGPPPGWYLDPGGLQVLRWWDGRQWGPQTQPLPGLTQESQPPHPDATASGTGGYGAFPSQQGDAGQQGQQGRPKTGAAHAPGPQGPQPPQHGKPGASHWVRNTFAVIGVLAAAGVIISFLSGGSTAPPVTSHGTVTLYSGLLSGLNVQDSYPDITSGSQVTVTDSSGKVLGTGTLSYSSAQTSALVLMSAAVAKLPSYDFTQDVAVYTFTATVPGGLDRYGLTVGRNRGTIWESAPQMKDPGLTLGSLSG